MMFLNIMTTKLFYFAFIGKKLGQKILGSKILSKNYVIKWWKR